MVERLIQEQGGHPKAEQVFGQLAKQFQMKAQYLQAQGKKKAAQQSKQIAQKLKRKMKNEK